MNGDVDLVAVPGQRLVDGVVDDLVDQVMQSRTGSGTDIHGRALAHRGQAFEHLDALGAVLVVVLIGHGFLKLRDFR